MNVSELSNPFVVVAQRATPLTDAARLMREHHVGSLVVVDESGKGRVPVGMLTDRDIVVAAVAARGGSPYADRGRGDERRARHGARQRRGRGRAPPDAAPRHPARAGGVGRGDA